MTVLATRGGGVVLVDDGDGMGHVESGGGVGPSMPVDSILKWGYWRPVDEELTAAAPLEGEKPLVKLYTTLLNRNIERTVASYKRAMAQLTAADQPDLSKILDESWLEREQRKKLKAAREKLAREAATAQAAQFGISFAVRSPYLARLIDEHAGKQAERIVEGSRQAVARVITESFEEGWSVPQTATAIRAKLGQVKKWQATMLARTDLIGLANAGSYAAALQLGESAPVYKRWINADDQRVRPTHVEAMNQVRPLEQPFQVGQAQLRFPGDPLGPDEEVINCRCTQVYLDDPALVRDHLGRNLALSASTWDESEHPRHRDGRFRSIGDVEEANPDVMMEAHESDEGIELHAISTFERGQGHASKALDDLGAYADSVGKNVYLTPEQADDEEGTLTTAQLKAWYKRHGYEKSHRKMEDYAFSHSMVRRTRGTTAAGWVESEHPRHPAGREEGGRFAPKDMGGPTGALSEKIRPLTPGEMADMFAQRNSRIRDELEFTQANFQPSGIKEQVAMALAARLDEDPEWKPQVILDYAQDDALARGSYPSEQAASLMVSQWAKSATDTNVLSLVVQQAVADEFGIGSFNAESIIANDQTSSGFEKTTVRDLYRSALSNDELYGSVKAYVRAQYAETQAKFGGTGDVLLWRGMRFGHYEPNGAFVSKSPFPDGVSTVGFDQNPASSWTTDYTSSKQFTDIFNGTVIFAARVPVSRILATPLTGMGCLGEREVVLIGAGHGEDEAIVGSWVPTREERRIWETTGYDEGKGPVTQDEFLMRYAEGR